MVAYADRAEGGRVLAAALSAYAGRRDVTVLGVARGGVVVASEVAAALHAPLDVAVVRKVGAPGQEELAIGAVASGGVLVLNEDLVRRLDISKEVLEEVVAAARAELARREALYRGQTPLGSLGGRCIVLVDDGLATGATMAAAIVGVRRAGVSRVVAAAPVGAEETCEALRTVADEVVCPLTPSPFGGVGSWYADFRQTSDREVQLLLERGRGVRDGERSA